MSLESASFFWKRISHDNAFAKCFEGVDSPDMLLKTAKCWGYDFTPQDLKHAIITLCNMSEHELESVSGGGGRNVMREICALVLKL